MSNIIARIAKLECVSGAGLAVKILSMTPDLTKSPAEQDCQRVSIEWPGGNHCIERLEGEAPGEFRSRAELEGLAAAIVQDPKTVYLAPSALLI